jgi:hypothetical protein
MSNHPVHLRVEPPERSARLHVAIRLALLAVLGAVGCSSLYWLAYLALPAIAALLIAQKGAERYVTEDATKILPALRWLAGIYAYLWLLTDTVPSSAGGSSVELEVETVGNPTSASALLRLLYSLPALILLTVLSFVACFLWVIGAMAILIVRRVPRFAADFLNLTLRYQFRLIAYHLALVDAYPSFEEVEIPHPSRSGAA